MAPAEFDYDHVVSHSWNCIRVHLPPLTDSQSTNNLLVMINYWSNTIIILDFITAVCILELQ